ncbi:MAG TPA: cation diffusion facilitator family transporter [Nitrososphaeraceae archaeon]|nr:cation diffusion facilitator family transporter [Nitrososphaeraceae archaeon]
MVVKSKKAVYAALLGNLGIAIAKLLAALYTGSSAMWAETYHSFSDTMNQVLLLIGIKSSSRPASERHSFGYGKEQFFWSFLVSTMIFGISGVLSLQQGLESLLGKPHIIENIEINYIILAISAIFELNALRIAFVIFSKNIHARGQKLTVKTILNEFRESKDPTILTVLVEDSAALLGIAIAAIGISLSHLTGNVFYDSISSLIIGFVLMGFAFFLAKENKALLIGESISKKDSNRIIKSILTLSEVNRVISMRTMHLGPEDVIVAIEVSLVDNLVTDNIEILIDKIEQKVIEVIPYVNPSKIYVELQDDKSLNKL